MTRILIILSIIISIPNISFADVVDTCPTTMSVEGEDTEVAIDESNCNANDGCYWKKNKGMSIPGYEGSCEKCPNGKYGAGCKESCPADFQNSPVGAKDISECYATCEDADIENGKITYTQNTVKYNDHGETCDKYKQIICKTTPNDPCLSYHWNGDKCVISWGRTTENADPRIDNCSERLQYYTSYWNITQYCLKCADGYSLKESKLVMSDRTKTCDIEQSVGTECMETKISCATALEGKKISTPDNLRTWTLDGPFNIEHEVIWLSDFNRYSYDNCSGKYNGTNAYGETKTITCTGIAHDSDNNTYKWNNCTLGTSTKCPDGKCIMPGKSDCSDAHRGYYAESSERECQACPGGTTTDGHGKTSKSACQIKTDRSGEAQTQFCDSTGHCFQLNTTVTKYIDIDF